MTLVSGASQYLSASTLANTKGKAPSIPTLLSQSTDVASILDAGRNAMSVPGIGISSNSRALTNQFLSRSADINSLFSYGLGADATIEGMQQQILAIRSTLPISQLHESVLNLGELLDTEA